MAQQNSTVVSDSQPEPLMTAKQLSTYLGVPPSTIYAWRLDGNGPPCIRLGKASFRWRPGDVEAWLAERLETNGKS